MRKLLLVCSLAVLTVIGACFSEPEKFGVRPSGPGQTVMASSQSVAIASDQSTVPFNSMAPTTMTALTLTDATDGGSAACVRGIYISSAGDGGLVLNPVAAAATATAITLAGVPAGVFPVAVQRVAVTGTTTGPIYCLKN